MLNSEIVDKAKGTYEIILNKFVQSNAPLRQVEQNLEILPQVLQNAEKQGKSIDVVDFVNNNVNLV